VLFVDDDATLLRSVARAMRYQGYEVTTAHSGEEAIKQMESRRFDVVASDISMPGMNGIQLLRRLREKDLLVPFILITGEPAVDRERPARSVHLDHR
jgi:two-component system OmpR family response regulator